jgi:hypothetical protein
MVKATVMQFALARKTGIAGSPMSAAQAEQNT